MKEIDPGNKGIHKVSPDAHPQKAKSKDSGLSGEFSRILSQHQAGPDPGSPDGTAPAGGPSHGGLPELEGTYQARMVQPVSSSPSDAVPEQISQAIDLLDHYAAGLADPGTTLKQAWGLLERITDQTKQIHENLGADPADHPRLREILTHLSTVVELEKIKINRGDYS